MTHLQKMLAVTGSFALVTQLTGTAGRQAPTASRLVGTWRLVDYAFDNHQIDPNRGAHPIGLLQYDTTGHMGVQIMPDRVRPKFAGPVPTADEARSALLGYTAYFGTYTVDDRAQTVTHHRQGSLNPTDTGRDLVRRFVFESADKMVLVPLDGPPRTLTWERIK